MRHRVFDMGEGFKKFQRESLVELLKTFPDEAMSGAVIRVVIEESGLPKEKKEELLKKLDEVMNKT